MIPLDKAERARRRLLPAVGLVCVTYGVPPDLVASNSRHRKVSLARSITCYLGDEVLFMEQEEIARALSVSRWCVYGAVQRVRENMGLLKQAKGLAMMLRGQALAEPVKKLDLQLPDCWPDHTWDRGPQ